MRIGILVDDAMTESPGGIGQYVRNLVEALLSIDKTNEYVLVYASTSPQTPWSQAVQERRNLSWVRIPITLRKLTRLYWPILRTHRPERWTGPLDVLHITSGVTRVPSRSNTVLTVYDLFPELFPEFFRWTGRIYRKFMLAQVKESSTSIIAISRATASALESYTGIERHRVTAIPLGLPGRSDVVDADSNEVSAKYNLPRRYILFIGRIDPRKNIENLIRAYEIIRQKQSEFPYHLVLAGSLGWQAEQIIGVKDSLGLEQWVHVLGYVPDSDVFPLLRSAGLFVYPSLCEGFGFPLLEAMSCNTPVAASNTFSIPEVAGDAAAYFDPSDIDDMAESIRAALNDDQTRNDLIAAGHERLNLFDWETTAHQTLEVYERAFRQGAK